MVKQKNSILNFIFLSLLCFFLFFSCSPKIEFDFNTITPKENSEITANISFSTGISDTAVIAIKNLTGIPEESPLFDKEAISESLKTSGLKEKKVSVNSDSSLDVKVYSSDLSKIGNSQKPIFTTTYNKTTKEYSVSTILNPKTFESLFTIFPEEFADYAELLMAPIFTGENLSETEYLDLLAAAYGNSLQKELSDSVCILQGKTPGVITDFSWNNEKIKKFNGKKNFLLSVPLVSFLSNNEGISFNICWK